MHGTFGWAPNYDVIPDGQRFVIIKQSEASAACINVTPNWFEKLVEQFTQNPRRLARTSGQGQDIEFLQGQSV